MGQKNSSSKSRDNKAPYCPRVMPKATSVKISSHTVAGSWCEYKEEVANMWSEKRWVKTICRHTWHTSATPLNLEGQTWFRHFWLILFEGGELGTYSPASYYSESSCKVRAGDKKGIESLGAEVMTRKVCRRKTKANSSWLVCSAICLSSRWRLHSHVILRPHDSKLRLLQLLNKSSSLFFPLGICLDCLIWK